MFEKLKPLVINLDGTLIRSDLLLESSLLYIKSNPFHFYRLFLWLMNGGKACLKRNLANRVSLSVKYLPYNKNVIEWLHEEKKTGRALILVTTSYKDQVVQIANHVGLFDKILASEGDINLSAKNKSNKLINLFGKRGFDYVGNSKSDLEIWKHADKAILVFPRRNIERHANLFGNVKKIIQTNSFPWGSWVKGLRIYQWVKNFLIFFPYVLGHYFNSSFLLGSEVLAFLFFSLCASSVYILNDLLDLQEDRQHDQKKYRPFAKGTISIKTGLFVSFGLMFVASLLSFCFLPTRFFYILIIYYLLSLNYSIWLKRIVLLDVLILSLLYAIRIFAGSFAINMEPTFWILAFSMFIFMSLSLVKRYVELNHAYKKGNIHKKTNGRGYCPNDLEIIAVFGVTSGYLSVLIITLYIQNTQAVIFYHQPRLIWLICPTFLFWISRMWLLTYRDQMHSDPILFVLKDKVSIFISIFFIVIFFMAS